MAAAVIDVVDYYADHAQPHWKIAIVNKDSRLLFF
jgi:hypothetical protein